MKRARTGLVVAISLVAAACGGSGGGAAATASSGGTGSNWTIPLSEVVDGGPGQDGIPALDNPVFAPAMDDSMYWNRHLVVGVRIDGQALAFPHPVLNWHEVVNNNVNGDRFVLSYCPLTGSAVAWDVDDAVVRPDFGVSGLLYNSNLILYDRSTDSRWSQMLERAVEGVRVGESPNRIQVFETTWETWKLMFPDSQVLTTITGHERDYLTYPYGTYPWNDTLLFPVSRQDNRLHLKTRVIGIHATGASKVYQIEGFGETTQTINDQFDNEPIVVVGNSLLDFAAIYSRELPDGTILDFSPVQDQLPVVMTDSEGNSWDIFGMAVAGPRAGTELSMTDSFTAMWFAWVAFFENPEIHFN